jgi:hypothetical protein
MTRVARKVAYYRSKEFRSELNRLVGVDEQQIAVCLDTLIGSKKIPFHDENASVTQADSMDTAAVFAGLGGRQTKETSIVRVTDRLLSMKFQCEYGAAAMSMRKGRELAASEGTSSAFGSQLAKTFRKIWSAANGGREDGMLPVSLTIGWDGGPPNLFGLIKYSPLTGEKTMVYSTADLHASLPDPNDKRDFVQVGLVGGTLTSPMSFLLIGELMRQV